MRRADSQQERDYVRGYRVPQRFLSVMLRFSSTLTCHTRGGSRRSSDTKCSQRNFVAQFCVGLRSISEVSAKARLTTSAAMPAMAPQPCRLRGLRLASAVVGCCAGRLGPSFVRLAGAATQSGRPASSYGIGWGPGSPISSVLSSLSASTWKIRRVGVPAITTSGTSSPWSTHQMR